MKVSAFIATSLDGFIARKNGDIDWLNEFNKPDESEDYGYHAFVDTVDCMVMGRITLDKVIEFKEWPYEDMRVIVLSNTLQEVPIHLMDKIELYSGSLPKLLLMLENEGCKRLYIDGGKTIQSFLIQNLITDITITKIPVLLGEGIPLFGWLEKDLKFKHIETKSYPSGLVQSTYEV